MSDCKTFAPWGENGGGRMAVRRALYEPLIYLHADGSYDLDLAKEIKEVSDGVYEVEIYDYIVDTAGNPMTADDVIFSYEKGKEIATLTPYYDGLDSIEKVDDYKVRFTFGNEKVGGMELLFDRIYVVTKAGFEQSGDEMSLTPIGTTHYVLDEYVSGQKMVFKRADSYWQTPELTIPSQQANIEGFTWLVINEKSQQAIALESGTIDASNSITSADEVNFMAPDGSDLPGYAHVDAVNNSINGSLQFNCSDDSICSDENLRKAICYAVDNEAVLKAYYGNSAVPARNFTIPAMMDYKPEYDLDDYYDYNVDKAKEALGKSDYNGETLVLLCNSDTENTTMATLIQAYCDAIGVKVTVEYYDKNLTNSYLADPTYHFDVYLGTAYGNGYCAGAISMMTTGYYDNGTGVNRIADEELTKLYDIASTKKTSSTETMMDLFDYVNDHCYCYALGSFNQKVFYRTDKIAELGTTRDKFNITPNTSVIK